MIMTPMAVMIEAVMIVIKAISIPWPLADQDKGGRC